MNDMAHSQLRVYRVALLKGCRRRRRASVPRGNPDAQLAHRKQRKRQPRCLTLCDMHDVHASNSQTVHYLALPPLTCTFFCSQWTEAAEATQRPAKGGIFEVRPMHILRGLSGCGRMQRSRSVACVVVLLSACESHNYRQLALIAQTCMGAGRTQPDHRRAAGKLEKPDLTAGL